MGLQVSRRDVWLALAEADAALQALDAVDAGDNLAGLYAGGAAVTLAYEELRRSNGDLPRAYATCMEFVRQCHGWSRHPIMVSMLVVPDGLSSEEEESAALQRAISHAAAYAMNVSAARGSSNSVGWRNVAAALADLTARLGPRHTTSAERVISLTETEA